MTMSNCATCKYMDDSEEIHPWCYMFKVEPEAETCEKHTGNKFSISEIYEAMRFYNQQVARRNANST